MSGEDQWRAVIHFASLSFLRPPISSALVAVTLAAVVAQPKKTKIRGGKRRDALTFLRPQQGMFLLVQIPRQKGLLRLVLPAWNRPRPEQARL